MAGLLPLMALAPWTLQAQPVYQPTEQQAQPAPDQQSPPPAQQPPPPGAVPPDQQTQQPAPTPYTEAQLDQMLAPIALYPDTLLGDILMASTYPIQVVEAERWVEDPHNAAIHGDALVDALQPMTWDPSVKSLVPFPQILKQMSDQLDWTQSLGTAFTYQQADVMARVQALRHQAETAGKLSSTAELRVTDQGPDVVIEPANPAVVYVPVYNPQVVYGPWAYAAYPPFYFPPPPGFFVGTVGLGIGFSVGFGIVEPFWGWGHPAWGARSIVVNNAYYSRISYNRAGFGGGTWHHSGPVGFHGPAGGPGFQGAGAGFHNAAAFHGAAAGRGFGGAAGGHGFAGARTRAATARGFGGSHATAGRSFGHASARGVGGRRSSGSGRSFGGSRSFGANHATSRTASHFGGGFGHGGGATRSFSRGGGFRAAAPRGGGGGRSFGHGGGGHGGGHSGGGGRPR